MRTLDKYILGEFTRTVVIGLAAFIAIFVTLDMVENVDDFVDNNVPPAVVLKYYALQVPYIFTLTLPVAVLVSSLFTVGQMARRNELVAMKASGIRFARAVAPLAAGGIAATILAIGVAEFIEPTADAMVRNIKATQITKSAALSEPRIRSNISYRGKNGLFYFAPEYDTRLNTMKDLVVERTQQGKLIFRLNAAKAAWRDTAWVVSDAWVRWFTADGEVEREEHISEGSVPLIKDYPKDILREQRNPEEMSYRELAHLVRRINQSGGDSAKYRVGLNMKISFPFANLIVILIGSPLSARLRRGGMAVGVGMGLAVCFIYYGFMRVGQALGDHSVLPPVLAAWAGNVFFAICGIILIYKAERQ
ncbi:MAG TPA: LptF/LptG family permease [bacterium]|nr:LptF/LptG family permease [bacterium]